MAYLLGIDIGTSGTKTVLFKENGEAVASATYEYPLYQPRPGWAEQDPEDWWNATVQGIGTVLKQSGVHSREIKGVGLSGQMHGLVMLDKSGNVLGRSIIWCDQRTQAQCDLITERIGRERLLAITANPAVTGFTASKILWVREHQPRLYEQTAKILLPKDYIRYKLTGTYATDVSDASGMQLMDIPNRCWSDVILEKLQIDKALLGELYESCQEAGRISKEGAQATGLAEGTIVAGGAGDQAAAAVGNGIVKDGMVSAVIGTSGVVFAHSDDAVIDPEGRVHTFCHAVPGAWHMMGVTQGAGLSLRWFRDNFCREEIQQAKAESKGPYYIMDKEAEQAAAGCDGLLYLPYLMGERSPHLDSNAKGVFFGLTARHQKADMIRAVMEGVGYSLLDCMEVMRSMGKNALRVRAGGGGATSKLWRQILSDMFECDVETVQAKEGGALGAAILAGVSCGVYRSVQEACKELICKNAVTQPTDAAKIYRQYYPVYKGLYGALKPSFDAEAKIEK